MRKEQLVEEVQNLYMSSEYEEFAQWAEETFYKMIPYLPIKQLKELKNELEEIQDGYLFKHFGR
jgi:tRNA A37 N6-isopentenylltransferase MiaA